MTQHLNKIKFKYCYESLKNIKPNSMEKVLVVEDNLEMQILLESALNGIYDYRILSRLDEAQKLSSVHWDAIILDLTLPDGHGLDLFLGDGHQFLDYFPPPVVIILSAADDIQSKSTAFDFGIDDYMTKPFTIPELRLRLEARLRKNRKSSTDQWLFADLKIELDKQKVYVLNQQAEIDLELTPNEFKLLVFLSRHPKTDFSRKQLLEQIWSNTPSITERTIDTHVAHLRKKIKISRVEISSVVGIGYKLMLKD